MRTVHKLLDIMNQKKLYSFIRARQSYLWLYENFVCVSLCLVSLCAQLNAKKTQKKEEAHELNHTGTMLLSNYMNTFQNMYDNGQSD